MRHSLSGAFIILLASIAGIGAAQAQTKSSETKAPVAQAPIAISSIPVEMTRHFETVHKSLQPTAKSWIEQQARIESQRPALDLPALNKAIHQRFANSNVNLGDADISALVFMVMMQCAQNEQEDLKQMMDQMQAFNKQKQAIRQLEEEMNQAAAEMAKQSAGTQCATALCESLPARLANIRGATSKMRRPVNLMVSEHPTYGEVARIRAQLPGASDSLADLSQEQQLQMQMVMDRMTKAMEAASNMEKKMSDTVSSIIANMK